MPTVVFFNSVNNRGRKGDLAFANHATGYCDRSLRLWESP